MRRWFFFCCTPIVPSIFILVASHWIDSVVLIQYIAMIPLVVAFNGIFLLGYGTAALWCNIASAFIFALFLWSATSLPVLLLFKTMNPLMKWSLWILGWMLLLHVVKYLTSPSILFQNSGISYPHTLRFKIVFQASVIFFILFAGIGLAMLPLLTFASLIIYQEKNQLLLDRRAFSEFLIQHSFSVTVYAAIIYALVTTGRGVTISTATVLSFLLVTSSALLMQCMKAR